MPGPNRPRGMPSIQAHAIDRRGFEGGRLLLLRKMHWPRTADPLPLSRESRREANGRESTLACPTCGPAEGRGKPRSASARDRRLPRDDQRVAILVLTTNFPQFWRNLQS
jgi:hypothetical protein